MSENDQALIEQYLVPLLLPAASQHSVSTDPFHRPMGLSLSGLSFLQSCRAIRMDDYLLSASQPLDWQDLVQGEREKDAKPEHVVKREIRKLALDVEMLSDGVGGYDGDIASLR
jgi:hypothetical protein